MTNTFRGILTLSLLAVPLTLIAWAGSAALAEEDAYEGFRKRVVKDGDGEGEGDKASDRKKDREGEEKGRKRDRDGERAEGEGRRRGDEGESEEGRIIKAIAKAKVDLAGAITKAEQASGGKAIAARYVGHDGRLYVLVQLVTDRGKTAAAVNVNTGKIRLRKGFQRGDEGEGKGRKRGGDREGEGGRKGGREGEGGRKGQRDGDRGGEGRKRQRDGDEGEGSRDG
jgi:hypothetical protein